MSVVTWMSTVELLTLCGELVPSAKLVPTLSEVFSRSVVRGEVTVAEEEELSGNVEETGKGEVISSEGTKKGAVLVSDPEEVSIHDTLSDPTFRTVDISVAVTVLVPAESVSG